MKKYAYKDDSAKNTSVGFGFLLLLCAGLMVVTSGCSVKYEFGWHGKTGRDDRVQTRLVDDGDDAQTKRKY